MAVAAVVAVLVVVWVLSRRIAVVVSGLLLLATLAFSAWETGGWINVGVIAATAVVAVLVFAWARSRKKPPFGPGGAQREGDRLRLLHRQAHPDGPREFALKAVHGHITREGAKALWRARTRAEHLT